MTDDDICDIVNRFTDKAWNGGDLDLIDELFAADVVATFEEVSGRPFEMQHVPTDALVAGWEGSEDPVSKSINALMVDFASGDVNRDG